MKICELCIANILNSSEYWDYHHWLYISPAAHSEGEPHKSVITQEKQSSSNCLFCSTLQGDICSLAPDIQTQLKTESQCPIYRWNIRCLAKIQESMDTIVITFRPASNALEQKGILPVRIFLAFPENELGVLPTIERLGLTTNPRQNGGHQIRSWIKSCDETHHGCMKRRMATPQTSRFIPTRLLDISGSEVPIRVIETNSTSVTEPYCSLSHCWGRTALPRTLKENRERFMTTGVQESDLSLNFKEAIDTARFMGLKYIWIDSLCIIQDIDEDWKKEASLMHEVYRNSYCNIAIVDAEDGTKGAYRKRDPENVSPVRYVPDDESSLFGKKAWRIVSKELWDSELLQTKLYVRGWVFQERMLAPRILHFAKNQIFWDCPSLSACESLPGGLPLPMDRVAGPDRHWRGRMQESEDSTELLVGVNDDSVHGFWKSAVWKYTNCNLTKGSDKLIAMWGIAKLVRDALGVEYGDGLWEQDLEDQLVWRVAECKLEVRPSEVDSWEIGRDIPTWSWASMDGAIVVPDQLTYRSHFTVKDHDHEPLTFNLLRGTESVDRDDQPKFHSKLISIQGHVGRGQLCRDDARNRWTLRLTELSTLSIEAFPDVIPKLEDPHIGQPYFVVLSAKQVNRDRNEVNAEEEQDTEIGQRVESAGQEEEKFDITGHGVLMKDIGNNEFCRTGAFEFRNIKHTEFEQLLQTHNSEGISSDMYDLEYGRKFWLA